VQYWERDEPQWNCIRDHLALIGVLLTVGAGYFGWTMIHNVHAGVQLMAEQARSERGVRAL
jgi:hypothetical protein